LAPRGQRLTSCATGPSPFDLASEIAAAVGIDWYVVGGATLIDCMTPRRFSEAVAL